MGDADVQRRYASFLVRCWTLADGKPRIRIEHIQSGETAQVATLRAALDWLGTRLSGPKADGSALENERMRTSRSSRHSVSTGGGTESDGRGRIDQVDRNP